MFVKIEEVTEDKNGNSSITDTTVVECNRYHLHIQPDVSKFIIVCVNEDGKIMHKGEWGPKWQHIVYIMSNHGEIINTHAWDRPEEQSGESSSFEERGLSARRQSAKLKMKGMKEM